MKTGRGKSLRRPGKGNRDLFKHFSKEKCLLWGERDPAKNEFLSDLLDISTLSNKNFSTSEIKCKT